MSVAATLAPKGLGLSQKNVFENLGPEPPFNKGQKIDFLNPLQTYHNVPSYFQRM